MHCKSYSHFFSKNFQHICVSLDVNFNESLTNDVVSFEQLGPAYHQILLLNKLSEYTVVSKLCMKMKSIIQRCAQTIVEGVNAPETQINFFEREVSSFS